jgi:diguanylate cyclase (GGDEF)-like protein
MWGTRVKLWTARAVIVAALLLLVIGDAKADAALAAPTVSGRWAALAETSFDHLDHRVGMTDEYVMAIAEDAQGFLWIGTQTGLYRYDGYEFKSYRHDPEIASSLPSDVVLALTTDDTGRLWVGTESGGLARYDRLIDGFVTYRAGVSSDEVESIQSDHEGGIWAATWGGLDHIGSAAGPIRHFRHDPADPTSLPSDQLLSVLQDREGRLWVGTEIGLVERRSANGGFTRVSHADAAAAKALRDRITCLFEASDGRILVGTASSGAVWIDPAQDSAGLVPPPKGRSVEIAINAIAEMAPGEIWFATDGAGIRTLSNSLVDRKPLRHDPSVASSLSDDHPRVLFRDRRGLVWVGTGAGLDRLDPSTGTPTGSVKTILGGSSMNEGISDAQIMALAVGPDGLVWVGLANGGIDILDPASHRVASLRPDPAHPNASLPDSSINAIAAGADGTMLIGTDHGLYRADRHGHGVARVTLPEAMPSSRIRTLLLMQDQLWIGTQEGLVRYRADLGGDLKMYPADPGGMGGLSDGRIMVVQPDRDGHLWVGTQHGLNLLDPVSGSVERILPDPHNRASLSNAVIASLAIDEFGRLWVGSVGGGLDIMTGRDDAGRPVFRHLGIKDGLPSMQIDALLMDEQHRIWVSTDSRMAVVDPQSLHVTSLLAADGVRIADYWQQTAAKTADGELLFGGQGGLTVIRPEAVHSAAPIVPIVLTDVRVGHRRVPAGIFDQPGMATPITVLPDDRSFQLEFVGLDFVAPELDRYSYRLDGFDQDWVDAPQRAVTYTNLAPGDYQLHLRAQSRDSGWHERAMPIQVTVQPAYYQTLWFRLLAGLLLLGLVVGVIQARTASLRRRRAELQQLVEQRTAELVSANARLEALATTDGLTGLVNRRRFIEIAGQEMERSRRNGRPLCIALSDLDKFKSVNDTHGHLAGDMVLRTTAVRCRDACRKSETVARYGGEEFIVLLPESTLAAAARACERIRAAVASAPIPIPDGVLPITISIGVAAWTGVEETLEQLIDRADKALYRAKENGRNRVEEAEPPV